jgi:hypothetical protein
MPHQRRHEARANGRRAANGSLLALCGLALLSGCSGFEKRWQAAAAAQGGAVEINDITGRWQGTWVSDATGHSGGLRCIITRGGADGAAGADAAGAGDAGDAYRAEFKASYLKFLTFGYDMRLAIERRDETYTHFRGEADLGWLAGGRYEYEGRASGEEFHCVYRAEKDYGHFRMHRPDQPAEPATRMADADRAESSAGQ